METLYTITPLSITSILSFCVLLLPLRSCQTIKEFDYWNGDNDRIPLVTNRPFPWNKITVPYLLQVDNEAIKRDYENFYIFVYVLLSLGLALIMYYCVKCCNCIKACSAQQRRRNNYTRANRNTTGRRQQYDRLNQQSLTLILNFGNQEESPLTNQPSDRPPDYSTVVQCDFPSEQIRFQEVKPQNKTETPPPVYDENVFKIADRPPMK